MEDLGGEVCQICTKNERRYRCPKCNISYCSVTCYKQPVHLACSETFYKECINEELQGGRNNSDNDVRKMLDILKRVKEADSGGAPDFSNDPLDSEVDSDDDLPEMNEEEADEDLADRLEGVNLNDAGDVWEVLTASERQEFENMVETGNIMKLVPDYKPWWFKDTAIIVDLTEKSKEDSKSNIMPRPKIAQNIPKFAQLCKKSPSPSVHYILWNIVAAYSCIVRFYNGDHILFSTQAVLNLVNICVAFKFASSFDNAEDAITSVMMETLTTRASANTIAEEFIQIESREVLESDSKSLMSCQQNKLAALSDMLELFKAAKKELRNPENKDLHKLFALCAGSIEIDRTKLNHFIKKIEFMLAYVML